MRRATRCMAASPKGRMNQSVYYHPDPNRNGTYNLRGGHFLNEDLGLFDSNFFSLTGAEARAMDPQQRILLELSYEALENAGIPLREIAGSDTAVLVGSSCSDYADLLQCDPEKTELFQSTGTGQTMLSNRISYSYNLKGPSATIDTACSSSLVALHLACNTLRLGEASMAIVGGSNLILSPDPMLALSMLRFLSPDGRCYTYDERANGFGRGEGASCIVLKPLNAAIGNGDTIRAVIRNTGTNQDGKTMGITLPSGDAQLDLMKRTYEAAGLDPALTSYVEAHGTGTSAGDPIEAVSLSKMFSQGRSLDQPLKVGSIKSNIGHLEGGSGLAGVVKTVLMLENKLILPNFDFQKANPRIPMHDWKIAVPTSLQYWPVESLHRASINNFGFGGSNAHVVIDDAEGYLSSHGLTGRQKRPMRQSYKIAGPTNGFSVHAHTDISRIFVLSAFNELSGEGQGKALRHYFSQQKRDSANNILDDLAHTLSKRRSVLPWKAAFSAASLPQLIKTIASNSLKFVKLPEAKRIGFVFNGQGAQWHAMGRELIIQYPVYRISLELADRYLKSLGARWSLIDELSKDADLSEIHNPFLSQPLTTAVQIALVDLLASWNVRPIRVTGHSSGEIAAAYCVGALSQESALAVAYHRGRVASKLKATKDGAMLAIGLSEDEAKPLLARLRQGRVKVACVNSPINITVSGDRSAIFELLTMLEDRDVFVRLLAVEVAYHSHHMEDVADEYMSALQNLNLTRGAPNTIEFHSSVTGKQAAIVDFGPGYWVANMVNSVQFLASMQGVLLSRDVRTKSRRDPASEIDILIEVGPHSALQAPIKQILHQTLTSSLSRVQYLSTLIRNNHAVESCQNLVAQLFVNGYPVDLHAVNEPSGSKDRQVLVDLPPYPWDHSTSHWAESADRHEASLSPYSRSDILGIRVRDWNSLEPCWRNVVRPSEVPWIQDHIIQSNIVYPAAGFFAMAIEAVYQHKGQSHKDTKGYSLREVSIGHAMIIPQDSENLETMICLRPYSESLRASSDIWDEFRVFSSSNGTSWTENCRGLISLLKSTRSTEVDDGRQARQESEAILAMQRNFETDCETPTNAQEIYKALDGLGLSLGPTFANMTKVRVSQDRCIAEITVPDTAAIMPAQFEYPFVVHPATLDSCIHAVFPIGGRYLQKDQGSPLPTFIGELFVSHAISKAPGHTFTIFAQSEEKVLGKNKERHGFGNESHSLSVFDPELRELEPSIIIKGLLLTSLANNTSRETESLEDKVYYQTAWQPDPSYLSPAQVVNITSAHRLPFEQKDQARELKQAAFYYSERALDSISASDVLGMEPHHRKLHDSLSAFCNDVREEHQGVFSTTEWLRLGHEERTSLCSRVNQTSYGILLSHIGENLSSILRKEIDPLSLMMEDDRLERYYSGNQSARQSYQQAAIYIRILGNKNTHLKVFEIGAGTGGATIPILEALSGVNGRTPKFASYDFTDLSPAFFENAAEKTSRWSGLVTFKKLDIECDPIAQGFNVASYDVIVAANVLHATTNIEKTMQRVRSLLKPGGTLVLIELTVETMAVSLIFGTLPGWWIRQEASRQKGPLLSEDDWNTVLHATGFGDTDAILWDMPDQASHHSSTIITRLNTDEQKDLPAITTVIDTAIPDPCLDHLIGMLAGVGIEPKVASLSECDPTNTVCIVLSELTRSVLRNPSTADYEAVKRIFLEGAGVLWVTRGALMESSEPDLNLVTGLCRTIRAEKGDTMIATLNLDAQDPLSNSGTAEKIFAIFTANFLKRGSEALDTETEYVEQKGTTLIPRLVEDEYLTSFVATEIGPPVAEDQLFCQNDRHFKAEIRTPGHLDTIQFVDDESMLGDLHDDFVQMDVKAAGMNFRDVMSALGQISNYPLGCECSGVVSFVGKQVQNFKPGDHVIANVKDGCFRNTVRAPAQELEPIPTTLPFEVTAALPIVYFTAYWAIYKVARLSKDETILIHAASGGLGQAIMNLCQLVGAKIYATVGTLEKKHLLMTEYNIPEDCIFSSRDGTFAKGVMTMTRGRGVDVIMNSLSGEALRLTWNCIAPFGRFVELGKRDFTINSRLEMRHFEKNVSFTGLDVPLDSHFDEKKRIWTEIIALYEKGLINTPQPITVYGISELEKALRIMQSGKHMGKLVLMPRPHEMVKILPTRTEDKVLRADASYLLIGGLGGIGRAAASWMLKQGARHLIFASPSGSEKQKAKEAIAQLTDQGAQVTVFKCDISNVADLDRVLEESGRNMPPIRGVIHAAMVPKADLFANLSLEDYNDIMRPKVDGVWNLHNRLSKTDPDFFIMLSSVVGVSGNPSQAAYVAASVFLDAFADYRNQQGLPAVTLDLGRIVDIGIVADSISARRGVRDLWSRNIREDEVMAMIKSAIINPLRKTGPGSSISGLKAWSPEADPVYLTPLFSHFRRAAMGKSRNTGPGVTGLSMRETLRQATSPEDAAKKACEGIMAKASSLLMIPPEDMSQDKSLAEYGMDSLVAVELQNWLLRELDATVPILELLANVSLRQLSVNILKRSKLVSLTVVGTDGPS